MTSAAAPITFTNGNDVTVTIGAGDRVIYKGDAYTVTTITGSEYEDLLIEIRLGDQPWAVRRLIDGHATDVTAA